MFRSVEERRSYADQVCEHLYPGCNQGFLWLMTNSLAPDASQLEFVRQGWRAMERAIQEIALECERRGWPPIHRQCTVPNPTRLEPRSTGLSLPSGCSLRREENRSADARWRRERG